MSANRVSLLNVFFSTSLLLHSMAVTWVTLTCIFISWLRSLELMLWHWRFSSGEWKSIEQCCGPVMDLGSIKSRQHELVKKQIFRNVCVRYLFDWRHLWRSVLCAWEVFSGPSLAAQLSWPFPITDSIRFKCHIRFKFRICTDYIGLWKCWCFYPY